MAATAVSVLIDTALQRLKEDGVSTLVTGQDWDPTTVSGVFVDPPSRTAMLLPAVLDGANWQTQNSGIYSKIALGSISSLTDSANWETFGVDTGGPFIRYKKANAAGLSGAVALSQINQPMVIEWFTGQDTNSARGTLECWWGTSADTAATDVALRFYDDGKVEVWKGGVQVGEGSISEKKEYAEAILGTAAQSIKNRYTSILLIPFRDRELLVASTMGGAFVHVFEDLAEETANLTIVPSGNFYFNIPAPISCQGLRLAYLQYVASGTISGRPSAWRIAPTGTIHQKVYQSLTESSLSGALSVTQVTPSSPLVTMANPVQIKASLTNVGGKTPFLYGARLYTDPQTANTSATDTDVTPHVLRLGMEFGDNVNGSRVNLTLTRPAAIATLGSPKIQSQCNRPFSVMAGDEVIFQGKLPTPHWVDGFSFLDNDSAQKIEFEGHSIWDDAEEYRFGDPIPLDGYSLGDAYRLVCATIGLPVPHVSSAADTVMLGNAGIKKGKDGFNLMIEVGDTGSTWLDRLHQTFAGLWHHGIEYGSGASAYPRLALLAPSDMPATAAVTLYRTIAESIAAGNTDDPAKFVYTAHRREYLKAEANDIWVVGMDYRNQRPIVVHKRDASSADPTLDPAGRPNNWLAGLVKYSWMDPGLSTIDLCQYAMTMIYPRVTAQRELHEFSCQRLPNVKQGDLVLLKGAADDGSDVEVRIKTMGGDFRSESAGSDTRAGYIFEPFHYVGEAGNLVCPIGAPGTTVADIKRGHEVKQYSDHTNWGANTSLADSLIRMIYNIQVAP